MSHDLMLYAVARERPNEYFDLLLSNTESHISGGSGRIRADLPIVELPAERWRNLNGLPSRMLIREVEHFGRVHDPERRFTQLLWSSLDRFDNGSHWAIHPDLLSSDAREGVASWA